MNRKAAIQFLHDRHPHVIDAPGDEVDLEALHLEVFWFGGYVSECIDRKAKRGLKRAFETIQQIGVEGDRDVRSSMIEDFLQHIVFAREIDWARQYMPHALAESSRELERKMREILPD